MQGRSPRRQIRSRKGAKAIGWRYRMTGPPVADATAAPAALHQPDGRPIVFARETYIQRRRDLISRLDGGIVLLPGNGESPINYADNSYPFRQDSTFLYYLGLAEPDLCAVIDVDAGTATVFGDELTMDMIVWTGQLPTIAERAEQGGVTETRPRSALRDVVQKARAAGRRVHFLPPYRADTARLIAELLETAAAGEDDASLPLIQAVVAQRSRKSAEEVAEIEKAVAVSVGMHEAAMRIAAPGITESTMAAEVERVANASGGRLAYPIIGTVNGQTLHNHRYVNTLADGRVFLLDAGAETALGYAADLTSSFPVSRSGFNERQSAVWQILLRSYDAAVSALAPGVAYRDVHFTAARVIFEGMKDLGLMKGDTDEALAAGAHALVFPHGLGHMMGLDVHDMEGLGEDHVGYAGEARSTQFGLKSLRLARPLETGFVLTVEPGIYFIPQLIDDWRARGHCADFIAFEALERWKDFGGVRNEENYVVTDTGVRRLGPHKPQTEEEMAAVRAQ
jgi:Xaa-Pro aminopeptidase